MKKKILKSTCAALAAVVMVTGFWYGSQEPADTTVPQLVSYVDTLNEDGIVTIESDEVPLSSKPVVSTKTTTKTKTKKTKLKKKSKKTSKKTTRKTKKSSSVKVTSTQKIATATNVLTTTTTSLKKNSKVKTVKTTVKTTVTTTTTNIASTAKKTSTAGSTTTGKTTAANNSAAKTTVAVRSIAPKAHANVLSAYEKLNFKVTVDSSVNYSGKFDARTQSIIVQKNSDDAIYHELGHFVAFVAGNADKTSEFQTIFANEKSKFVATRGNASYITGSAEEYFAESYQDYVENPTALKSARPQTYAYIVNAVSKVTDAKVTQLKQLYASIWN